MNNDDAIIKNFVEHINVLNASLDRLARFRSRVCQAICAGGEESDELIIDKLRDLISAKPAASPLTQDQRAEVREIVHEVLDEEWQRKLDEDAGKW